MTTEQHPGGVAGRVIRECENERYGGLIANGAYRLRHEMSREARAILADTLSDPDPNPLVQFALYAGQKQMAERLGLDLESEDE